MTPRSVSIWHLIFVTTILCRSTLTNASFVHPSTHSRKTTNSRTCRRFLCGPTKIFFDDTSVADEQRRHLLEMTITSFTFFVTDPSNAASQQSSLNSSGITGIHDINLRSYRTPKLPNWQGTALDIFSLSEAAKKITTASKSSPALPMGRWPDPILRRPASKIPVSVFQHADQLEELRMVASALRNTARKEGAVGLAAQQCGVDASLIFIDGVHQKQTNQSRNSVFGEGRTLGENRDDGIYLVNPRIIKRSKESEMLVWTEECLVLPPQFRATLLRDAMVTIEYEALHGDEYGMTKQITFKGELARCAQHEMDHDRGVLIVDHVGLNELLSVGGDNFMASIENADGLHETRIQRAYERYLSDSVLLPRDEKVVPLAYESYNDIQSRVTEFDYTLTHQKLQPWFAEPACAAEYTPTDPNRTKSKTTTNIIQSITAHDANNPECDESCIEARKARIEARRALMRQSRTNTNRGDVLKLSEQRAALYGSSYDGLPSRTCTSPGFCP